METNRMRNAGGYDTIVVGARCAGASTAMLLARAGQRVLLLERAAEGSDTLSTLALMRGGVMQLHRWGLLPEIVEAGTPAIHRSVFHYPDVSFPVQTGEAGGVDALYAPRRPVLERSLLDAARRAGVDARFRTRVESVVRDPQGRVRGVQGVDSEGRRFEVRADLVVGADGRQSMVAAAVGAPIERQDWHATGNIYGFFEDPGADGYRWFFGERASAGFIPTNDGLICAFAGFPQAEYQGRLSAGVDSAFRKALRQASPSGAESLSDARQVGKYFRFSGQPGFMRRCVGPGWALVGDASHFKDPCTAHGITDALRDAELLARAALEGGATGMERYASTRDALSAGIHRITNQIAAFKWNADELASLHRELSREMKREVDYLSGLDRGRVESAA